MSKEPPITKAVREELRRLVRKDPRTQEKIAEAMGVSTDTLERRLGGQARQRFADAEVLLEALGYSPLYLAEVVRLACVRCGARAPVAFGGALILPANPADSEWRRPPTPSTTQGRLAAACERAEDLLGNDQKE